MMFGRVVVGKPTRHHPSQPSQVALVACVQLGCNMGPELMSILSVPLVDIAQVNTRILFNHYHTLMLQKLIMSLHLPLYVLLRVLKRLFC